MRRFHLLSYLAGIVTIGILMGVNIQYCRVNGSRVGVNDDSWVEKHFYGFPFDAYMRRGISVSQREYERLRETDELWAGAARVWESNPMATVNMNQSQITRDGIRYVCIHAHDWFVSGIIFNAVVGLIYVYLVMTFFEAILLYRARGESEASV